MIFLFNNDVTVKVAYDEYTQEHVQYAKKVYERLGSCDGVIVCFNLSPWSSHGLYGHQPTG